MIWKIINAILSKLLGWSKSSQAQSAVDDKEIASLKEDKRHAEVVENKPAPSSDAVSSSLRGGTF